MTAPLYKIDDIVIYNEYYPRQGKVVSAVYREESEMFTEFSPWVYKVQVKPPTIWDDGLEMVEEKMIQCKL